MIVAVIEVEDPTRTPAITRTSATAIPITATISIADDDVRITTTALANAPGRTITATTFRHIAAVATPIALH